MNKTTIYKFFIVLGLVIFFFGCIEEKNGSPIKNGTKTEKNIVFGPIIIIKEYEFILSRNNTRPENNTNISNISNKTIPDYTFEPEKNLFIFFINASYTPNPYLAVPQERHGEAILIKKGDADILIDSGVAEQSTYLVNFLKAKGVDDLELFIITHARQENYGGMESILEHFEIEQFMWNKDNGGDQTYSSLLKKVEEKNIKIIEANYLTQLSLNGINFLVINPRNGTERFFNIDNDGIVLKITDRNFSIMTTGDVPFGAQLRIEKHYDPKSTVLQIPNYGLGSGSSNIFFLLDKVSPESAVITGHYVDPLDERLKIRESLKLKGIKYYTTYNASRSSTNIVRIISDGQEYSISIQ